MKLKIVIFLLIQLILFNSCAKTNGYLNKKFLNAEEDFSVIIKENELEFYDRSFTKDPESLTKKVFLYDFQQLSP